MPPTWLRDFYLSHLQPSSGAGQKSPDPSQPIVDKIIEEKYASGVGISGLTALYLYLNENFFTAASVFLLDIKDNWSSSLIKW